MARPEIFRIEVALFFTIFLYATRKKFFIMAIFFKHYSVLNDFTGLAIAALIAWKLTVINAIRIAAAPPIKKAVQPIFILNAKSCNHLLIPQYANGIAIT